MMLQHWQRFMQRRAALVQQAWRNQCCAALGATTTTTARPSVAGSVGRRQSVSTAAAARSDGDSSDGSVEVQEADEQWARYRCTVAYDGTRFHGFQRQGMQSDDPVVETVCSALQRNFEGFAGHGNVGLVTGSSRTDAGVHALANSFHIDILNRRSRTGELCDPYTPAKVMRAVNHHLRTDSRLSNSVNIFNVERVLPSFHARFVAAQRTYLYRILVPNDYSRDSHVFEYKRAWDLNKPQQMLDVAAMQGQEAAVHFLGYHDFTSFQASGDEASPMRTVDVVGVDWEPESVVAKIQGDFAPYRILNIVVSARSFIYNQVRLMVGALVDVGVGFYTPDSIMYLLEARSRGSVRTKAPPHGLYLVSVDYRPYQVLAHSREGV